MQALALDRNQLTGAIPPELGALRLVWFVSLSENQLSGPIPAELAALPRLAALYLSGNPGLSGCVPPALREVETNDLADVALPDCPP